MKIKSTTSLNSSIYDADEMMRWTHALAIPGALGDFCSGTAYEKLIPYMLATKQMTHNAQWGERIEIIEL